MGWAFCFEFFFFQAEDGIRDYKVTGVQTCALPISNEDEALALTGKPPREAAAALSERFAIACVKRGAAGALAAQAGRMHSVPAPHKLDQDVAGAGDAFAAGLLVALARGQALEEALTLGCRLGTAAAAAS